MRAELTWFRSFSRLLIFSATWWLLFCSLVRNTRELKLTWFRSFSRLLIFSATWWLLFCSLVRRFATLENWNWPDSAPSPSCWSSPPRGDYYSAPWSAGSQHMRDELTWFRSFSRLLIFSATWWLLFCSFVRRFVSSSRRLRSSARSCSALRRSSCSQGWKKPGFFKNKPAQWVFLVFLFFLIFWVF